MVAGMSRDPAITSDPYELGSKDRQRLTDDDVARLRRSFAALGDELPPEIVAGAPWPRSRLFDEDLYPQRVERTPEQVKRDTEFINKVLDEALKDAERRRARLANEQHKTGERQ